MTRPRQSTLVATALVLVAILLGVTAVLLGLSAEPRGGKIVVTVRLWDEPIAAAYRQSFAAFTRSHPDIEVRTNLVAYSTYFETLRTDVAGGSADDIFWLSNAYFAAYADSGRLMKIQTDAADWEPAVVDQFTRSGVLWGVPQLTDAGIAVFYNADLLAAAGVDPRRWTTCDGVAAMTTPCARCWLGSPSTPMDAPPTRQDSMLGGSASGDTTPPTILRPSTLTTSARPAVCSSATASSRSITPAPSKPSAIWSA